MLKVCIQGFVEGRSVPAFLDRLRSRIMILKPAGKEAIYPGGP